MKKYLRISETSERTGFSEKAIRCLMARGRFPYTKVSGRIRVSEEELEKFLELSRKVSAEEAMEKEVA